MSYNLSLNVILCHYFLSLSLSFYTHHVVYVYNGLFPTACTQLPKIGDQQPNVFIRTNLIRAPKGMQAPLVLAYTEVIQVCYLYCV